MGHLVGDWLVPVSRVAAAAGVSWHTTHDAFAGVAAEAGICPTDAKTSAEAEARPEPGPGTDAEPGTDSTAGTAVPAGPCRAGPGVLPPVGVLGIDDHRRGKPLYHRDPAGRGWLTPTAGRPCSSMP